MRKSTLKVLEKAVIKERWFDNVKFKHFFVHTYLGTKALVVGRKRPTFILMDKHFNIFKVMPDGIKESKEEVLKSELALEERLLSNEPRGICGKRKGFWFIGAPLESD